MKKITQLSNKEKVEILIEARSLIESGEQRYICIALLLVLLSKGLEMPSTEEIQEYFNMNFEEAKQNFGADGEISWWNLSSHETIKECTDLRITYINHLITKLQ